MCLLKLVGFFQIYTQEWNCWIMLLCLVAHLCLTLWDPMDCSLPGSSVHGDSAGKNSGVGCHALLHGIFPTQGSNPGLPHSMRVLYLLSHQGSPRILEWVAYPFSRVSSPTQELNQGLLHYRSYVAVLFLVFWEPPIVFSTVAIPTVYMSFPFLHIFTNICCLCSFWW